MHGDHLASHLTSHLASHLTSHLTSRLASRLASFLASCPLGALNLAGEWYQVHSQAEWGGRRAVGATVGQQVWIGLRPGSWLCFTCSGLKQAACYPELLFFAFNEKFNSCLTGLSWDLNEMMSGPGCCGVTNMSLVFVFKLGLAF